VVLPDVTRTRVVRRITADPTSTALLLTGPAAIDLWPGVRRVGDAGGRALVETELPDTGATTAAAVRALPPRRTPTSYVTRFDWTGHGLPSTKAVLTLAYAPAPDGVLTTHAVLELASDLTAEVRVDEARLRGMATTFLDNLGRAAEQRSEAA